MARCVRLRQKPERDNPRTFLRLAFFQTRAPHWSRNVPPNVKGIKGERKIRESSGVSEKNSVDAKRYWTATIRLAHSLLANWLMVSSGAGILFRDFLDHFFIGIAPPQEVQHLIEAIRVPGTQ